MRVIFLYFLGLIIILSYIWVTFSGYYLGALVLTVFLLAGLILSFCDLILLLMIGAREIQSDDKPQLSQIVSQESYKLSLKTPKIYFYHGHLERAFIFYQRNRSHLVIGKNLLVTCSELELRAIVFELLLQVKRGMAPKKTKLMFMLIFFMGLIHFVLSLFLSLCPFLSLRKAIQWTIHYMTLPVIDLIFHVVIGKGYFKKLSSSLQEFPTESWHWKAVQERFYSPDVLHSLSYKKLMTFFHLDRGHLFQNIFILESFPHEWDYLLVSSENSSAS